jgi:hypothetical protein
MSTEGETSDHFVTSEHPGYYTAEVGYLGGTYELLCRKRNFTNFFVPAAGA